MSRIHWLTRAVLGSLTLAVYLSGRLAAQATSQDHPGQYSTIDIETGSRLYAGQCAQCHGPNGDIVSGIDLRRGQFRRPLSDDDLSLKGLR